MQAILTKVGLGKKNIGTLVVKDAAEDPKLEARSAGQIIVRRFSLEAAWPSSNPDYMKSLLVRMTHTISKQYGRDVKGIAIEDLERAQGRLKAICGKAGISKLRYSTFRPLALIDAITQTW